MELAERHVARQQESLWRHLVAIVIDETRPLLAVKPQQINAFAHAGKARIGVGIRIRIVGKDGSLLCFNAKSRRQHHDKQECDMCDFRLQFR